MRWSEVFPARRSVVMEEGRFTRWIERGWALNSLNWPPQGIAVDTITLVCKFVVLGTQYFRNTFVYYQIFTAHTQSVREGNISSLSVHIGGGSIP